VKETFAARVVVRVARARRRARQIKDGFCGSAVAARGGREHQLLAGVRVLEAEAALGAHKETIFGREAAQIVRDHGQS